MTNTVLALGLTALTAAPALPQQQSTSRPAASDARTRSVYVSVLDNKDALYSFNYAEFLITSSYVPARTYGLDVIVRFNP